jgi:concentrative nucleoside transporter, CNT family
MRGLLGLALLFALAVAVSANRSRIRWRTVAAGFAMQVASALLVLKWSVGKGALEWFAGQV